MGEEEKKNEEKRREALGAWAKGKGVEKEEGEKKTKTLNTYQWNSIGVSGRYSDSRRADIARLSRKMGDAEGQKRVGTRRRNIQTDQPTHLGKPRGWKRFPIHRRRLQEKRGRGSCWWLDESEEERKENDERKRSESGSR